jgi:uncharacterized protein involved in exopolysaccharide biosynthesis
LAVFSSRQAKPAGALKSENGEAIDRGVIRDMNDKNIVLPAEQSADISLRDLLTPLFRRKRILIVTFFSALGAVILLAALMGPAFTSRMTILVNRERLDPLMTPESTTQLVTTGTPITEEEINSEVELLSSRDVLEEVAIANGLDRPSKGWSLGSLLHPNQTRQDRIALAVKNLAKAIKIEAVTKTNLIQVKYSSSDPQLAYGVLKSLGEFYTQKHVAVHRPAGSYEFFAGETRRYHDALEQAEANLRDLETRTRVAAPDAQETNLALQVATSVGLMHLAEQSLAADDERMRNDRQQMSKTPQRSPTRQTSAAADKLLDQLNTNLLTVETKRTELLMKYDPSYPLVRDIDQEIAQTKAAIADAEKTRYITESTDLDPTFEVLREDDARTQADRAAQAATLAATKRSIRSMQGQLVDLDQQSITRQDLQREVKADEQSYLTYLAKREQERTSDALDVTRIANVAIAVPPAIPVLPALGWPVIMLAAVCVAGVASIGGAYAADYLDSSFQSPAQLTDGLGIPVVVTFPKRTA